MKIYSSNVSNGKLEKQFGKHGTDFVNGMPSRSMHIAWQDLPEGTQTLAIIFLDHEAIPVCGFSWIHWTVANIDPHKNELAENASIDDELLQGVNSWNSGLLPKERQLTKAQASAYGGCAPPDKTHNYTIVVYALDTTLDLAPGFYMNELLSAMEGHVLAEARLCFDYDS